MSAAQAPKLPAATRRRGIYLAYANGALWAIGDGMVTTGLVVYLALDLGAKGIAISLILAAAPLVGSLRLVAPELIRRIGSRHRFAAGAYAVAVIFLLLLPRLAEPGRLPLAAGIAALVGCWAAYHLAEYLGTVALWSYLGDLAPRPIRGRFIGYRERWINACRIPAMLAAGLFVYVWREEHSRSLWWQGYAYCAQAGAAFLLAAVVPLLRLPDLRQGASRAGPSWREYLAPLRDRRFRRLLYFGMWFSLTNGLTQSAQYVFAKYAIGLSLFWLLAFRSGMRLGQSAAGPAVGRLVDRIGNRPVLIVSQVLVATALAFFLVATPSTWFLLGGAWLLWIAYAGLNVGLPNLMLKLSPYSSAHYIAAYFALTGICYGISTIVGGVLFEWLDDIQPQVTLAGVTLDHFRLQFVAGWALRLSGVLLLWRIIEPRSTLVA